MELIKPSHLIFIETVEREYEMDKDPELLQLLNKWKQKKLKLIDHAIYTIKSVAGAQQVEFLRTDENKATGLRNIANAKLEKDRFFVPVGIQLLGKTLAGVTDTHLINGEYGSILSLDAINNAEVDFKINDSTYLLREFAAANFVTDGNGDKNTGLHILSNTAVIKPELRNELILKSGVAMPADTAAKFVIYGTSTYPRS
ncbi:MAG: hypothetical protein ACK40G_13910 [Cytophagaceae bacterium]